jgi:hypothetical protein
VTAATGVDARAIARAGLLEVYRDEGRTVWLEATGRSMEPLIPAGSQLQVEFGARPTRLGEIVLFRGADGAIAHRVVAWHAAGPERGLVAKGDGEPLADRPVSTDAVLGVVREVRRADGRPVPAATARRRGATLARVSRWSGQAARLGGYAGRRMPAPARPLAIHTARSIARVPTRLLTALMPRLDRG